MKALRNVLLVTLVFANVIAAFHAAGFTYYYDSTAKENPKKPMPFTEKLRTAFFGYRHRKTVVVTTPAFPFETKILLNELGQELEVWRSLPRGKKGTVILCHGHGDSKSDLLPEAAFFYRLGFEVVLFDFRAHGNSEGNVTTLGFNETADLLAVYDFVHHSGQANIVLWGRSMGASTILKAIPQFALAPSRVILECPFATMYDAVAGKLGTMRVPAEPATSMLMIWGSVLRNVWMFGYRPVEYAYSVKMPVLLSRGALDSRVSQAEIDAIYRNLPSRQKQLVIFENSRHESYLTHDQAKWEQAVKNFLEL